MTTMTDAERLDKGNRPADYYKCSVCGRVVGKMNLRVKRAVFKTLGAKGSTIKSRAVSWLCIIPQDDGSPACLDLDEDYTAESMRGTPGAAGTRLDG